MKVSMENKAKNILTKLISNTALADVLLVLLCAFASILIFWTAGEPDMKLILWVVVYSLVLAAVITLLHFTR